MSIFSKPKGGTPGPAGASAYQTWLALGNTGDEADFIASLRGASGETPSSSRFIEFPLSSLELIEFGLPFLDPMERLYGVLPLTAEDGHCVLRLINDLATPAVPDAPVVLALPTDFSGELLIDAEQLGFPVVIVDESNAEKPDPLTPPPFITNVYCVAVVPARALADVRPNPRFYVEFPGRQVWLLGAAQYVPNWETLHAAAIPSEAEPGLEVALLTFDEPVILDFKPRLGLRPRVLYAVSTSDGPSGGPGWPPGLALRVRVGSSGMDMFSATYNGSVFTEEVGSAANGQYTLSPGEILRLSVVTPPMMDGALCTLRLRSAATRYTLIR
jgi:hypothetical protein